MFLWLVLEAHLDQSHPRPNGRNISLGTSRRQAFISLMRLAFFFAVPLVQVIRPNPGTPNPKLPQRRPLVSRAVHPALLQQRNNLLSESLELQWVPNVDIEPIHRPSLEPVRHFPSNRFRRSHECSRPQLTAEFHGLAQCESFFPGLIGDAFGGGEEAAARGFEAFLGERRVKIVLAEVVQPKLRPNSLSASSKLWSTS
jgi:hypothetical protein